MKKLDFFSNRVLGITLLASIFISLTIITFALVIRNSQEDELPTNSKDASEIEIYTTGNEEDYLPDNAIVELGDLEGVEGGIKEEE